MRKLILSLVVLTYSILPCVAAEVEQPKPSFKVKHPKIYRAFKKTRTVSRFVLPIVQCAGSAAQCVMLFL